MDGTFTVITTENNTGAPRTGTITVTAGDATPVTVPVNQQPQDTLSVTPANYTVGGGDNSLYTYTVTKSASTYSVSANVGWVSIVESAGSFTVQAPTDNTGPERVATITVTSGNATPVAVTFTQGAGGTMSITPSTYTVASNDQTTRNYTVTLTNQTTFTAISADAWITIVPSATSFTVNANSNNTTGVSRTATITVTAPGIDPQTVTFIQSAQNTLSVTPSTQSIAYNDLTAKTYTVTTNAGSYTATSNAGWAVVSQSAGSFTVTANSNNTTGATRTATITINAGSANPVTVTLVQAAQNTLSVTPLTLNFGALIGLSLDCTATASLGVYLATSNNTSWLTCTQVGNIITVVALTNLTGSARTGTITVTSGNATPVTITCNQAAQALLDVAPTSLTFAYNAADPQTVDVTTTAEVFTATANEPWITVVPDAQGFDVHVEEHDGEDIRSAKILVNDDLASEFEVSVEQLFPPYESKVSVELADDDGILRFSGSATSEVQRVNVSTEASLEDLKVDSSAWIIAEVVYPGVLTVQCALNDTGAEREGFVTVGGDKVYPATLRIIQGQW